MGMKFKPNETTGKIFVKFSIMTFFITFEKIYQATLHSAI